MHSSNLGCLLLLLAGGVAGRDTYVESVSARPVSCDVEFTCAAHVTFNLTVSGDAVHNGARAGAQLFPSQFGQLVDRLHVRRLRFSLSRGRWIKEWGVSTLPVPAAAAFAASFNNTVRGRGNLASSRQWRELVEASGGLFCASLAFLSPKSEPRCAHGALLTGPPAEREGWDVWGLLPTEEQICTENLTPLLSLLPGRGSAGLARVLNSPRVLFSSRYHSLVVDFAVRDGRKHLSIVAEAVFSASGGNFDLATAMGVPGVVPCVLCTEEPLLEVILPKHCFASLMAAPQVGWEWIKCSKDAAPEALASIDVTSFSHGDITGLLTFTVDVSVAVTALQVLLLFSPRRGQPFLHSMSLLDENEADPQWEVLHQLRDVKVDYRESFDVLSADVRIERRFRANSRMRIRVDFEKKLMPLNEYPPDANKLYELPSAVLWVRPEGSEWWGPSYPSGSYGFSLPSPDFSMPFNVITLSCTVVALFFGSVFNVVTRDALGDD